MPIAHLTSTPAATSMSTLPIPRLCEAISGIYRGNRAAVELVVIAFVAGGHVLLEDIPGVGKTTLARALAAQGRTDDAQTVRAELAQAWAGADKAAGDHQH